MAYNPQGKISGTGYIQNGPGAEIKYETEPIAEQDKVEIVLRMVHKLTWWKSLDLYINVAGNWTSISRIETKDAKKEASVSYFDFEMTDQFKLEFWKGGVAGFGAKVDSLIMDSYANLGQRIIFTWEAD